MKLVTKYTGGLVHSVDYDIIRNGMVKPKIVSEKNGIYTTDTGEKFVKDVFDNLFNPPKQKVKKKYKCENPDGTKKWMKD